MTTKRRIPRCTVLASIAGLAPLAFTGSVAAQQAVDAQVVSDQAVPGDARVVEVLDEAIDTRPPPAGIHVEPMQMMDDTGIVIESDPVQAGRTITFDQATGKVTIGAPDFDAEVPLEQQWIAGENGAFAPGLEDESAYMFGGRNMSALSQITPTTGFPWRANCRLLMRFVTTSGSDAYFSCSATLVDAKTVLTAGHCIFNRDADINDWAAEVWVYPGYEDNNGGAWQDVDAPFGFAKSAGLTSYTGWTQNGDFSYDMAFMKLNKPIGAKTGWFGYGYNNNCSFFTTPTHHNASYPAESAYGWTGRWMYYRFGDFDSCPFTNRVQYNSAGYGGMSGSSSYWINGGGSRFAYSVASTSDRATYTRHCDLWQSAFEYLRDTIIAASKPTTWDLWAMCTESSTTSVNAGNAMSDVRFLAANWSTQGVNSTYNFDMRLSTNDFISGSDTLLGNYNFSWNFGPTSSVWVNVGSVNVPIGQSGGSYHLGALLNVSDANSGNNDSSGDETHPVTVNAVRDPQAVSAAADNGTHYHNETFDVDYTVRNNGAASASSVTLDFRASLNTIISTGDVALGTLNLGTLSGGQTINGTRTVTVPSNINGPYYIGYIVTTTSTDANTGNNTAYDATSVTFDGRADMVATSMNAEDGSHFQTSSMGVQFVVDNDGTEASGIYTVEVRASTNTIISTFDTLLRTYNVVSLAPGGTHNFNSSVTIPAVLAPGPYYIGMIVGPGANETDLSDNTNYDARPVTIIECLADWNNDGVINTSDFLAYLNDYNRVLAGGSWAFHDPDIAAPIGALNTSDFLAFLNLYNAGCP